MLILAPITRRDRSRVSSRFRTPLFFALLAAACLINSSTLQAQGTAVRTETFSLDFGGQVRIENSRGATRVEVWEDQTVRIVAEKRTPSNSSLDPNEIVLMSIQNTVYIQCKQSPHPGRIDLIIYIPRQSHLRITGGGFPVSVDGSLASSVVETTGGAIAYRLPGDDDARVAMRSSRGIVRSNIPLVISERRGTQSLQGQLGSGSASIMLSSLSGGITLTPGPNLGMIARTISHQQSATPGGNQNKTDQSAAQAGQNDSFQRGSGARPAFDPGPPARDRQQENVETANDSDMPLSPGSSSSSTGGAAPATGNNSIVFAGGDRSDDASLSVRGGGPLVRPREERRTSGGSSGLKVRIIPSGRPLKQSQEPSDSIYDQQEEEARSTNQSSTLGGNSRTGGSGNPGSRTGSAGSYDSTYGAGSPQDGNGRVFSPRAGSNPRDNANETDEIASTRNRPNSPPVLQRESAGGAPDDATVRATTAGENNSEEEAIVLKAALVNLNVSVTNRSGVALANLKKEDFEVAENGQQQKVEFFQTTTAPFNLVLVLDLSGSIKDKLDIVKSAALRFLDVIGPQDRVAVVAFTHEVKVVSQLTANRDELKRRIKGIERPEGGTAFYEALWFSVTDTLRGTRGQRNAVVVMTDGVDSSLDRYNPAPTRVSFKQLANRLEESDTLVFPVYLDTEYEEVFERGNSTSEAYAIARDQLDVIAELTGGQKFRAEKVSDLSGIYKQVAAAIRTVYSVGYYPTNAERDGKYRRVRVSVSRPDAAVRTRKGYYAR
jgi:VWFA-related protein